MLTAPPSAFAAGGAADLVFKPDRRTEIKSDRTNTFEKYMALAAAASEAIWLSNIYTFATSSTSTKLVQILGHN